MCTAALILALTTGCTTWGVEPVEQTITARADAADIEGATGVHLDLSVEDTLEIHGRAAELAATLDVTAWVADANDVDPARDLQVSFRRRSDGAIHIDPDYADDLAEHVTLEAARVWLPEHLDLEVEGESHVRIAGVPGQIVAHTTGSHSLEVRDVGPVALTAGGTITAELSEGGSIHSSEGGVDLALTGNDFDILSVETGTGSVTVTVPRDLPLTLDLLPGGEGTTTLELSGARIADPANTARTLDLNGGGPLLYIRSGASITIRDGSPVAGS